MYSQCLIVFALITSSISNPTNKLSIIRIGALFDFEHPSVNNGRQDLRAAQIAITEINHRQKDLFHGNYVLRLISNNSRCDPIYAVDAFFHAIFRRPQLHFLVGTSCSNETKAIIDVADYYNLILFSHSTSFISQVNQSYSTLVRLSVSDENYNDARVAFIKYNNWSHTAIIHQDSIEQSLMMAKLAKYLNESNINVLFTQSASRLNLTSALRNLQGKKARIVFVNFDTSSRAIFFCDVYRTFIKEVRERYVWILTGNDYDSWNFSISNCTKEEILDAAHGHIIIDSSYTRKPSCINPNMGPVSFRNRQRQAETVISQFQIDTHRRHSIRIIAEYSQLSGFNTTCSKCRALLWPNKIPVDTERTEIRRVLLKFTDIILVTVACVLGLGLAIFFLIFNIIHRHERYIKLSSPKLNNVLIIGAMHIHIAILLFGFDQWFLEHNIPEHACIVRIFLLSGGFSLTFGSMFLKTLRVYRIFTSNDRPLLHSKLLQDYYLLLICLYLYGIDAIFTIVWQYFDPHFIVFAYGSIRRLDMDTVVSDEIYYCNSKYRQKILPFLYLYKSLFLIVGGYLAAKTRHVHIAALNDSKFIVWSIYIVVLTSLFTVIVMLSIQNLRVYIVLCFVVIMMTSVIICLVFLPKVSKLKHRNQGEVVSKELYMDDSRTRRLAVEISYFEVHRYAQLQNRELKAELIRFNHALTTLQQRLESTSTTVTMALFPFAVRFASTFLPKTDVLTSNTLSNHKTNEETVAFDEEATTIGIHSNEENDKDSIVDTTTSSDSFLHEFKQQTTSSSDSDLSVALQSFIDTSSLPLSSIDNQQNVTTDNEESSSLSPTQIMSDNESVLYLHLANELNMTKATLDSDLDRVGR
ncbi:unnamed protein product [Rotaria socialis]|uniref:G-protein coupled receptors family 3 profile domain-containing protein n=1 Tax=Rotaria socialis TaxID=392032 RepID=A0A820QD59_9BILA|nr:unnamed protein product [Rotaria socialis]CAF4314472.1 unnamed protein product [Rotaria socialis]CAF4418484.1 unnamed protein product [Rotaria socialis]CAF4570166.1 unnamed protein product [Rotaria socialis]